MQSGSCLKACYIPIYTNGKFAPADLLRYPRRDITYSAFHCVLTGKVYFTSPTFNRRPCDVTYLLSTLSEHQPKKGCQLVVAKLPTDFRLPLKETNSMSLACRESKVIRATIITTLAQTKHRASNNKISEIESLLGISKALFV